jgi:hypothetical protein
VRLREEGYEAKCSEDAGRVIEPRNRYSRGHGIDITADRAYVVVPASYEFKKNGKPTKETGSMFTFALQKGEAGWRITGWAWAKD